MKGITPIISIIILLLITIALAGVAYTYLMGQLWTRIGGSFSIPEGGDFCTNGQITIKVANTGTSTLSAADFDTLDVDGTDVTGNSAFNSALSLAPEESGNILAKYNCGSTCSSGYHTVDIGTKSSVLHRPVRC